MDVNKDGVVDLWELRNSLSQLGYLDSEVDSLMDILDEDGNGNVSLEEWVKHSSRILDIDMIACPMKGQQEEAQEDYTTNTSDDNSSEDD